MSHRIFDRSLSLCVNFVDRESNRWLDQPFDLDHNPDIEVDAPRIVGPEIGLNIGPGIQSGLES